MTTMRTKGLVVVVACAGFSVAFFALRKLILRKKILSLIEELQTDFDYSVTELSRLSQDISEALTLHLRIQTNYVDMPHLCRDANAYENCFGLDFGENYIRIGRVRLGTGRYVNSPPLIDVDQELIPQHVKQGTTEEVFDFIAMELKKFIESRNQTSLLNSGVLGFSFSFPIKGITESTGMLSKWTAAFADLDGIDIDVTEHLQRALDKVGLNIRADLMNDALSTLCSGFYCYRDIVAAVVIGTGTHACFLEKAGTYEQFTTLGQKVVDVDLAKFYARSLRKTLFDNDLDAESPNPHERVYEKLASGMYIGELVRRVILRILQERGKKLISKRLSTPFTLSSQMVAEMNKDRSPNLDKVEEVFRDVFEISAVPWEFREVVPKICGIVTRRCARLIAAGIVAILDNMLDTDEIPRRIRRRVILFDDGGLFRYNFLFEDYLEEAVRSIIKPGDIPYTILQGTTLGQVGGAVMIAAYRSSTSGVDTS